MSIIRYNKPYDFATEINRLMENALSNHSRTDNSSLANVSWVPSVDIRETEHEFLIHADLPGVHKDDIHINMEKNVLTIKGERKSENKTEENGFRRVERTYGSFGRCFTLPDTADNENIKAKMKDGVLDVSIPKVKAGQKQKIKIDVE